MEANDPLAEVEEILTTEMGKIESESKLILKFVMKMTVTDEKNAAMICARYEQAVSNYAAAVKMDVQTFASKLSNDRRLILLGMVAGAHFCGKELSFGVRDGE